MTTPVHWFGASTLEGDAIDFLMSQRSSMAQPGVVDDHGFGLVFPDQLVEGPFFPVGVSFGPVSIEPESAYRPILCAESFHRFAEILQIGREVVFEALVRPVFLPHGNSGVEKVSHSEKLYRDLLRQGSPRCHIVPHADWRVITDLVLELAHQRDVKHADLLNEIAEACADAGMEDSERRVNDVVFQLFKSGCFESAGGDEGQADFHWSNPARIAEGIESEADAMEQVSDFVVGLLEQRLEQKGLSPRVDPDVLHALMFGPLESADDTGVSSSSRSASIR